MWVPYIALWLQAVPAVHLFTGGVGGYPCPEVWTVTEWQTDVNLPE